MGKSLRMWDSMGGLFLSVKWGTRKWGQVDEAGRWESRAGWGQCGVLAGVKGPCGRKGYWPLLAAGADRFAVSGSCGPVNGF